MTTRREFLQTSLATAGLATMAGNLVGGSAFAAMQGPDAPPLTLSAALFEPALSASGAFAAAARSKDLLVLGIGRDITPTWQYVIQDWRRKPAAIAGLTSLTPLLLLEQSARDYGLRVVFRSEHRRDRHGLVTHMLEGPEEILDIFNAGVAQSDDYGACIFNAMVHCPATIGGRRQATRLQTTSAACGAPEDGALYSWIIAPRDQTVNQGATA